MSAKKNLRIRLILFLLFIAAMANLVAAQETVTATETPTPQTVTMVLTIFRDAGSLTIFVPQRQEYSSLTGLTLQVTTSTGEQIVKRVETDFTAFLGMPFHDLAMLTPICFRLVRSGTNTPAPQACQGSTLNLTETLFASDVFWRDSSTNQDRLVVLLRDDRILGVCPPGQSQCEISFVLLLPPPAPPPIITPFTESTATPSTTPWASPGVIPLPGGSPTRIPTQVAKRRLGEAGFYVELIDYEFRSLSNTSDIAPIILSIRFVNETDQSIEGRVDLRNIEGVDNTGTKYGEINSVVRRWCDNLTWPFHCNNVHEWVELENVTFTIPSHESRNMDILLQQEGIRGDQITRVSLQADWIDISIPIQYRTSEFHHLIGQWKLER